MDAPGVQALRRGLIAQRGHLTRAVNRFDAKRSQLGTSPSKADLTVFLELYQTLIERHKKCMDILDEVCSKVSEEVFAVNFEETLKEIEAKVDQIRDQYVAACNAGGDGGAGGGVGGGGAGKGHAKVDRDLRPEPLTHTPTLPQWRAFKRQWAIYSATGGINSSPLALQQGYLCSVINYDLQRKCDFKDEDTVAQMMTKLEDKISDLNPLVLRRLKYFATKQAKEELFSTTILRLRELEAISDIEALGTEDVKAFVMLTSVSDNDLRQELLESDTALTTKNIESVTAKFEATRSIQAGLGRPRKERPERGYRVEDGATAPSVPEGALRGASGSARGARGAGRGGRGAGRGGKQLTCYRCSSTQHLARQCSVPRESLICGKCGISGSHNTQSCFATPPGEPQGTQRGVDAAGNLEVAATVTQDTGKKDSSGMKDSQDTMTAMVNTVKKLQKSMKKVNRRSRSKHRHRDTSTESSASDSGAETGFLSFTQDNHDSIQGCFTRLQDMVMRRATKVRRVAGGRRKAIKERINVFCSFDKRGLTRSRSSCPTPPAELQVAADLAGVSSSPIWHGVPDTGCTSSLASTSFIKHINAKVDRSAKINLRGADRSVIPTEGMATVYMRAVSTDNRGLQPPVRMVDLVIVPQLAAPVMISHADQSRLGILSSMWPKFDERNLAGYDNFKLRGGHEDGDQAMCALMETGHGGDSSAVETIANTSGMDIIANVNINADTTDHLGEERRGPGGGVQGYTVLDEGGVVNGYCCQGSGVSSPSGQATGSGRCQQAGVSEGQGASLGTCVSSAGQDSGSLGCQHSGVRVHASDSLSGGNVRQVRQQKGYSAMDAWVQGTGMLHKVYTSQDKRGNCKLCKQEVVHQCAAPQSKFGVKVVLGWQHHERAFAAVRTLEEEADFPDTFPPLTLAVLRKYAELDPTLFSDHLIPGKYLAGPLATIKLKPNYKASQVTHIRGVPAALWKDYVTEHEKLCKAGCIKPLPLGTAVEFLAASFPVRKPSGQGVRIVQDQSDLNSQTVVSRHNFPAPRDVQRQLSPHAKLYFKTDLTSGYNQCLLDEDSQKLTAHLTQFGIFVNTRSAMGLVGSGFAFCSKTDAILNDCKEFCIKEVDDCLVEGQDDLDLSIKVEKFLMACVRGRITLSRRKTFVSNSITFGGFRITEGTVLPDEEKVEKLRNWPRPHTKLDIKKMLGFANIFSPWAPELATVCAKLRPLSYKDTEFVWNEVYEEHFQTLRRLISSDCVLRAFDLSKELQVVVDASKEALAYCLIQQYKQKDGSTRPYVIWCNSKKLDSRYAGLHPLYLESAAAVFALTDADWYIKGNLNGVTLLTDHQAVPQLIKKGRNLAPEKMDRFFQVLAEYPQVVVKYLPGTRNVLSDALSRTVELASPLDKTSRSADIDTADYLDSVLQVTDGIRDRLGEDELIAAFLLDMAGCKEYLDVARALHEHRSSAEVKHKLNSDNYSRKCLDFWGKLSVEHLYDGRLLVIYDGSRLYVPPSQVMKLARKVHVSCHQGLMKTMECARALYFWPNMRGTFEQLVGGCAECLLHAPSQPSCQPNQPRLAEVTQPMQTVFCDLFQLEKSHYLIMADLFSGYLWVKKLTTTDAGKVVAKLHSWWCTTGFPARACFDGGPPLNSAQLKDYLKEHGVTHQLSSVDNPNSNALAEVSVKLAKGVLKKAGKSKRAAQSAIFHLNCSARVRGYTPADLFFKRRLRSSLLPALPVELGKEALGTQAGNRLTAQVESYIKRSQKPQLPDLPVGATVVVQDTKGRHRLWRKKGSVVGRRAGGRSWLIQPEEGGKVRILNRKYVKLAPLETCSYVLEGRIGSDRGGMSLKSCMKGTSEVRPSRVRWATGEHSTRHSTRLTRQAEVPQLSGEHNPGLRQHRPGLGQHFLQALGSPYVPRGSVRVPVAAGGQVETGRGMPRGVQRTQSYSPGSTSSNDSFQGGSEESLASGRRVRQVPEGSATVPYVEVQVLKDAAAVAADITSHYDSMHAAVQRFTANEYGGSQFALAIKDQTLEMLRRTMVAKLDSLIDVDAQLEREQRRVKKLKRQVRALQEEQEAAEENDARPRKSNRRSL